MFSRIFGQQSLPDANISIKSASGVGADAVVTFTGNPNRRWVVHGIQWSYNVDPNTGRLTINDGVNISDWDIMKGGPGAFGIAWPAIYGNSVTITLQGVGGTTGKLSVQAANES